MPKLTKRKDGKLTLTWAEYQAIHRDFKGTWTTTIDATGKSARDNLGRRTCMTYENGTCLVLEGKGLVIEGAPRAHRLMLDKSNEGHYVVEFMDDDGDWIPMGWGLSEGAARELLAVSAKRNDKGNWTITYKEKAGEG